MKSTVNVKSLLIFINALWKTILPYINLLYRKVKSAIQTNKKLYDVFREDTLIEGQCLNSFLKFLSVSFNVKDSLRYLLNSVKTK